MIFSRRKAGPVSTSSPILLCTMDQDVIPTIAPTQRAPETIDEWHKRTDTDGTRRRALQTKRDNELL